MRPGWVDGRVVILGALASLLLRGVDGLNLYRYVRNNPVNLVDPDGMSPDPPPEYEEALQNAIDVYGAEGYDIHAHIKQDVDGNTSGLISMTRVNETIDATYNNGTWTTTITTVLIPADGSYQGVKSVESKDGLLLGMSTIK